MTDNLALRDRLVAAGWAPVTAAVLAEGRVVKVARRNRETGTAIVVRDFGPHATRALAISQAADPAGWCELCLGIAEDILRREQR